MPIDQLSALRSVADRLARPGVTGPFIWLRVDDQRQRSFVTAAGTGNPITKRTKTSEAVCMLTAVNDARRWPATASNSPQPHNRTGSACHASDGSAPIDRRL